MAFRAGESERIGYESAQNYLIPRPRDTDESQRERCKQVLRSIVDECGPVIDSYPTWHPIVTNHNERNPVTLPSPECGYDGLDHSRFFANGFITCPYDDGQKVIESVNSLPPNPVATIEAERLDVKFYSSSATSILVRCKWNKDILPNHMIPLNVALPLILEKEVPCWHWSELAETWETMKPYLLGAPHGSRSSLFIDQESGQAIKKIWTQIIESGMFGPIKV